MWILFNYECECGNEFESLVDRDNSKECECSCGKMAKKKLTAPKLKLDGTDPNSSEWHRWEKKRNQKLQQERKQAE